MEPATWRLWTTCPSPGDRNRGALHCPPGAWIHHRAGRGLGPGPVLACAVPDEQMLYPPLSVASLFLFPRAGWRGLPTLVTFYPQGGVPTFRASAAFFAFPTQVRQCPLPAPSLPSSSPSLVNNNSSLLTDLHLLGTRDVAVDLRETGIFLPPIKKKKVSVSSLSLCLSNK